MEGLTLSGQEYFCRKCSKFFSTKEYSADQFCPKCRTHLQPLPPPKCWLFQFNPALYRWFDRISETQEPEQWLTTHYASSISKGDKVAIWAAGEKAGIYALDQTITHPTRAALNPEQEKYWTDKSGISKFKEKPSVIVKYLKIMCDRPITQQQCRDDSVLSSFL